METLVGVGDWIQVLYKMLVCKKGMELFLFAVKRV